MRIDVPEDTHLPALKALWQLSFGDDETVISHFFATGYSPDRCRCLWENGQLAGALYWFPLICRDTKLAYLYAVAVHPDFRRRGLGRALLEDTHRHLAQAGYAGAVLVPAHEGLRHMYGDLGYRNCGGIRCLTAAAGDTPCPMKPLTPEEYLALRAAYLPRDSAAHEAPALRYLNTFARFYAGGDFLLAACREGNTLSGLELLGYTGAMPGILAALGCREGRFLCPGSAPLAMYRPLVPHCPRPAYFGLALE